MVGRTRAISATPCSFSRGGCLPLAVRAATGVEPCVCTHTFSAHTHYCFSCHRGPCSPSFLFPSPCLLTCSPAPASSGAAGRRPSTTTASPPSASSSKRPCAAAQPSSSSPAATRSARVGGGRQLFWRSPDKRWVFRRDQNGRQHATSPESLCGGSTTGQSNRASLRICQSCMAFGRTRSG